MKKISKVTMVVSKIMEVCHFVGVLVMAALLVCSFEVGETLAESIANGSPTVNVYSFECSIMNGTGEVNVAVLRVLAVVGMIMFFIMGMIFRNVYLIVKKSKDSTPFCRDNIRMIKEIGIFSIAMPVLGLIMSVFTKLICGVDNVEISVDMTGLVMGILVFCLMQFFAHGAELEEEVEGLV